MYRICQCRSSSALTFLGTESRQGWLPVDSLMWAIGRVSGFVSMFLLTGALLLGILARSGRPFLEIPRFSLALLHRNISLLATVFLIFHVGTLLLDSYAQLNVVDVIVPFLGRYEPFWQGLGTGWPSIWCWL